MLSDADKETLKDGVHAVLSGEFPMPTNVPFGVQWVRERLINRAYLSMQIVGDPDAAGVIEETMNTIVTLEVPFPNVSQADPDIHGESRWVISTGD